MSIFETRFLFKFTATSPYSSFVILYVSIFSIR